MKDKRCEGCPLQGTPYVPPQLHKNSKYLFIGQNPDQNEVDTGYPFCHKGKSGKLVRNYTDSLGVMFSMMNCVGCFKDKVPNRKEINYCKYKVDEAIEYTTPELIVVFGKPALYAVTGRSDGILKLNGKILRDGAIPVAVCVHPSYAEKTGRAKAVFEKGILPALKYFVEEPLLEYKTMETLPPTKEEVGFDIETGGLHPLRGEGKIKCFAVSDGNKAIFIEVDDES